MLYVPLTEVQEDVKIFDGRSLNSVKVHTAVPAVQEAEWEDCSSLRSLRPVWAAQQVLPQRGQREKEDKQNSGKRVN